MRLTARGVGIGSAIAVIGVAGLFAWITIAPPALLRVGSGYAAKIVCSNVFLAEREAGDVLSVDVQAPGHPLLRLMRVSVDRDERTVHAALLGLLAGNNAVYREGLGCTVTPDGALAAAGEVLPPRSTQSVDPAAVWPDGEKVKPDQSVVTLLSDPTLTGRGMRAVVVIKNGRVVGESYAPGFSVDTPMLGWSMAKTVNAALIGTLVRDGKMSLADKNLFPQWRGDQRGDISVANLLAMESGLAFNENYGAVADVTRMLFLEPDMATFAADAPLEADPGSRFSYSSGTSVLLSKVWMEKLGGAALTYPRDSLFAPLGMSSAVIETDAVGTFAGSSYMYATARDWGRFGLLLARDGVWNGTRILPEGFVALMGQPNGHSSGRYSQMQTWLPGREDAGIPADTFFMQGHDGQNIAVVRSEDLVVVRLGLTPSANRYDPKPLVAALAKALR